MAAFESTAIISCFSDLSDPRQDGKVVDPLVEVLILVLAAAMAGAEAFTEIERFGKVKLPLLRRFSGFETGTPPHDTLGDIFAALDFEAFQNGFAWAARCASTSTGWSGTGRSRLSRRARSRLCGGNGQSGAGRAAADKFTAVLPASEPLSALLRCSDASSTNRKGPHRGQDCDGALGRRFGARNLGCAAGRRRASAG